MNTTQSPRGAHGVGLATLDADGTVLDTWYAELALAPATTGSGTLRLEPAEAADRLGEDLVAGLGPDVTREVEVVAVATTIADLDEPPLDGHDAWLRLQLLYNSIVRH
ncbi:MAG: 2,3,4,5-tetrahydropyridine-2,6-dicarboxylate N-succinyltransferase, partial [Acidimicrobiia bacterium]